MSHVSLFDRQNYNYTYYRLFFPLFTPQRKNTLYWTDDQIIRQVSDKPHVIIKDPQCNYVVLNINVQHPYVHIINSCQLKNERKGLTKTSEWAVSLYIV